MRRVVVLTLVGCAGMSTAAAAQDEWYLETTVGAAWSATMDQQGHNSDHICYPTYVCSSSNGYRWSYN